ncbi:MAG: hypothetical protein LBE18_06845 [Planctomycetaceae bacterium]|jgi:hypothetical protein|nr:hypothetical protein [Planctomycetaceae bacterium]
MKNSILKSFFKRILCKILLICALIACIIILLYILFTFNIGAGGGLPFLKFFNNVVPSNETNVEIKKIETIKEIDTPDKTVETSQVNNQLILLRFELIISFETDPNNPDTIKEFACNIEKIDTSQIAENQKSRKSIVCENMQDFEFALDKEIREWLLAFDLINLDSQESAKNVKPILHIRMKPFPGEGVFRKIESIVRSVDSDSKINIMRSDN